MSSCCPVCSNETMGITITNSSFGKLYGDCKTCGFSDYLPASIDIVDGLKKCWELQIQPCECPDFGPRKDEFSI